MRRVFIASVASVLAAAAMPATPAAHRLDEYLQASRVSVARDRIALEVDLTPGVNIASDVIASLDRDGDTAISPIEAQSYGQSVLADLVVELDGRQVPLTLTRVEISPIAELREGMGAIRVQATATIDGSVAGRRELHLQNDHQPGKSVYLANALVPDTADVRIVRQSRDSRQRDLRIEYTVEPRWPVKVVWLLAGFSVLAGVLVQRARAYRKRAIAVGEKLGVNRDYPVSTGCTSPFAAILAAGLVATVSAQSSPAAQAARQWRQQHERAIVEEFMALLAIPNVSRDTANIQRNAEAIRDALIKRGATARLVSVPGANPIVFGEIRTPGAVRTIGFYAHYDGQPLDPKEWTTPPFTPTLRNRAIEAGGTVIPLPDAGTPFGPESRIYARGAADDKAPIIAQLAALDAIRAAGIAHRSNVKFMFEGEEEAGSPNLLSILEANRTLFAADIWLMCDGPVHQSRRQALYFGSRDGVRLDLTVYGPKSELHSGHYGNWAPNPALLLARLLASMKSESGQVTIDGFYDDVAPLNAAERKAVAEAPNIDRELMRDFLLGSTEGDGQSLTELITRPSLNIRGMASSRVGAEASNVIPSTATASIDIRLVKGMDPKRTADRVVAHIRKQGFFVVDAAATPEIRLANPRVIWVDRGRLGLGAVRTPLDLPIAQDVIRIVEQVRGSTVKLPNMGGNLPLADIERPLGAPTIVVPIGNHDNHQHSFDENLRLQNLWDGIELMAALLTM